MDTPALWRIEKPVGGRVWLLGTIHQLPASQQPDRHFFRNIRIQHLPPGLPDSLPWNHGVLRQAVHESRSLWVEIRDPGDPERLARLLGSQLPDCRPSLPEDTSISGELAMLAEEYRLSARAGLSASATLFLLTELQSRRDTLEHIGVEWWLAGLAGHKRIRIQGLETLAERASAIQRALAAVDCTERIRVVTRYLRAVSGAEPGSGPAHSYEIWRRGALERMAAELQALHDAEPLLYHALIRARNRAWLDSLEREISSPGVALVSVGMAHLAGPDNLVALLRGRGIAVERVQ